MGGIPRFWGGGTGDGNGNGGDMLGWVPGSLDCQCTCSELQPLNLAAVVVVIVDFAEGDLIWSIPPRTGVDHASPFSTHHDYSMIP